MGFTNISLHRIIPSEYLMFAYKIHAKMQKRLKNQCQFPVKIAVTVKQQISTLPLPATQLEGNYKRGPVKGSTGRS